MILKPHQLMVSGRFLPLFITQFLGAFNDNLFRSALIMLITFRLADQVGVSSAVLNNLAIGLFILPYFLFSALAGQLADKYEKTGQIVWIKIWEIVLATAGAIGFYYEILPLLMAVLAGLGLQSTFFGPIKYSIMPDLVDRPNLLSANALVEAGTFIAILLGTIVGGLVVLSDGGIMSIAGLTISIAVIGTLSGSKVVKTGRADPDLIISRNIFQSTGRLLKRAWADPVTRRTIIGISWIWTLGSIYLTQIPVMARDILYGDETVVTAILAIYSVGIGAGSIFASKILKGDISARLATPALLGLALVGGLLFVLLQLPGIPPENGDFHTFSSFLSKPLYWCILLVLCATSILGGMVIVPLYTILQDKSERHTRSQIIASNNIINSGFMFTGAVIAAGLLAAGLQTQDLFLVVGVFNLLIILAVKPLTKLLS
ncbi:hypothetical protein GCM10017044_02230 [Kordiimonas sediminis]|uniref:MFS transporter n=1 Tax=Kordiimonas sediminis TaxID=1735581 RepID=A0A919AKH6_9PROT|nr:MFS transporter [Kordiimonas sediminis]GHF11921.1 hypothetical protein GCM10017044_02230 [Kordiimonas sediminis]